MKRRASIFSYSLPIYALLFFCWLCVDCALIAMQIKKIATLPPVTTSQEFEALKGHLVLYYSEDTIHTKGVYQLQNFGVYCGFVLDMINITEFGKKGIYVQKLLEKDTLDIASLTFFPYNSPLYIRKASTKEKQVMLAQYLEGNVYFDSFGPRKFAEISRMFIQ